VQISSRRVVSHSFGWYTDYWELEEFLFSNQVQFFNAAFQNKTANDLYASSPSPEKSSP
jgi:hypothetical protein